MNILKNLSGLFESLSGEKYTGIFNSYIIDFTEKENNNSLFATKNNILAKYYNQIDYVIGNPPYITYYGRKDRKQSEQ